MVNSFSCNYFYKNKKTKKYFANGNNSCWAGLNYSLERVYLLGNNNIDYIYNIKRKIEGSSSFNEEDFDFENIYILLPKQHTYDNLNKLLYNKYITRIVNLINKITPCKKVIINDKLHIKYKLLNMYSQNLVLLNIIRMLWYKPFNINIDNFIQNILKPKEKNKDVLYFMFETINNTIEENPNRGQYKYGDHSCIYKNIKLKTSKQLLDYEGTSMEMFLTK